MALTALMFLLGVGQTALAEKPVDGQIGVTFQLEPEGMVLTRVHPTMGAAAAGLVAGDMVVAIDGAEVGGGNAQVGAQVKGALGSTVKLTVRSPLGGPEREVTVTRGARVARPPSERMNKVMARFQAALKTGKSPSAAKDAAEALVASGFLGKNPGEAIGSALNRAAKRHPRVARAALPVIAKAAGEDAGIHQRLGEAHFFLGEAKQARHHLAEAARFRSPDVQGADFTGNVDARYMAKEMLTKATWDAGEKDQAKALALALALTRDNPKMLAELGLEHPAPRTPVRVRLPPIPGFETTLLSGETWRLEEHRGKAVLLAFWASWCGPCKREMPELQAMWEDRKDLPFVLLAVSMDKEKDAAKVARAAKDWGMTFPVAHDPTLGRRMQVQGLPAVRLIGPSGSDRYAAKGYSAKGVETLRKRVDAIFKEIEAGDQLGEGPVVGKLWSRLQASVSHFVAVPGARSVAARPGGAVVGVRGTNPAVLTVEGGVLAGRAERDVSAKSTATAGRVDWQDGTVASAPGAWWVRKSGEEHSWMVTLPSPLQDLAVSGESVWVAMEDGLAVLSADGKKVASFDVDARDLSPDGSGGVWAVDGTTRYRCTLEGVVQSSPAAESWSVSSDGRWGGPRVIQLVSGRFGPEGQDRTLAVRQDGVVVGMDAQGEPAFSLSLSRPPIIAVQDVDEDGRDEVLVVIRGQGVATVKLELP